MDAFELRQKLSNQSDYNNLKIENQYIDIQNGLLLNSQYINPNLKIIQFLNCEFSGSEMFFENIENTELQIYFKNCSFNCKLFFAGLVIKGLKFIETKKIGPLLDLRSCKLEDLYFKGSKGINPELSGFVDISHNQINKIISFEFLNHIGGEFSFENNFIRNQKEDEDFDYPASFSDSKFHNASFLQNTFNNEVIFDRMQLTYDSHGSDESFGECKFESAYFNGVDFGGRCFFNGSNFKKKVLFVGCKNLAQTLADFSGCIFHDDALFDYSEFKKLTIKNTHFRGTASFEDTKFETIELVKTVFEKTAFFEGIEVINLNESSRKTIRSIKLELQKTDNRIDYNKFKAAELNAFKKELSVKQWKETFILWINNISSKHGLDWFRGVIFTLIVGFLSYIFYFLSENHSLQLSLRPESINHFIIGYFNFLLPTYKSPFTDGLNHWYQFIPFLLGKIFISYGIYQTIQAFRKFRL